MSTPQSDTPTPGDQPSVAPPQYAAPPPQYAAPPGAYAPSGQYYATQPPTPTNLFAILSLVFSILGVSMLPFLGSVVGVVMGHLATKQIKQSGEQGEGLAKAGLIIGYIGGGVILLIVLAYIAFFALIFGAAAFSA